MKKKILLLLFLSAICLIMMACSSKSNTFPEYSEWYDALNIGTTKGISVLSTENKTYSLTIYLDIDSRYFDSYNEIIRRHNEFVEEHPSYFSSDMSVYFMYCEGNHKAFNVLMECYNGKDIADGVSVGPKIRCIRGDIYHFKNRYELGKTVFPESILVLQSKDPGFYTDEDYGFLEQFPNLEQIILEYSGEYDRYAVVSAIEQYTSGVEVH